MDLQIRQFLFIVCFCFGKAHPIVGGGNSTEVVSGTHPYMVRITVKGILDRGGVSKHFLCGGVIVSKNAVLTAADCLTWSLEKPGILVSAGISDFLGEVTEGQRIYTEDYLIHDNFTKKELWNDDSLSFYVQNNVAIVWLGKDLKFNEKVAEARFIDPVTNIINKTGLTLGWGENHKGMISSKLKEGELRVLSIETCKNSYPGVNFSDEMICAISDTRKVIPCTGDNGGPYVIEDNVAGLISFSSIYDNKTVRQCDPMKPVVLTNVGKHIAWINYTLKLHEAKRSSLFAILPNSSDPPLINWVTFLYLLLLMNAACIVAINTASKYKIREEE